MTALYSSDSNAGNMEKTERHDAPLPRHWQDVTVMGPERHKAYALQWFALALAALLIYVAAALRNWRKARKTREEQ